MLREQYAPHVRSVLDYLFTVVIAFLKHLDISGDWGVKVSFEHESDLLPKAKLAKYRLQYV
jgi:hypothetical protein